MQIKSSDQTAFDLIALGECMLRLSPADHGRIEFTPALEVCVGGAEYNVAYALARLGLRTGWVGGLNASPLGRIVANHARAVGVDISHAIVRPFDGIGKKDRLGLNFTEVGTSQRAAMTWYDRGHSATAGIQPGEIDWSTLFQKQKVRWLHTSGILTALSKSAQHVVAEALQAAHEAGTVVSYDLNFRSKLWSSEMAIEATRPLLPNIDCLFGNEEDFQKVLGYDVPGVDVDRVSLDTDAFKSMVEQVVKDHPHIQIVATTLRGVKTALKNDWSAILWHKGTFWDGPSYRDLEIEDRVGGGDGFASGAIFGFLKGMSPQQCVDWGVAHGALLMSTRGDTSQITLDELKHVAQGGGARIQR